MGLVALPVFKTGGPAKSGPVGSIPTRLRQRHTKAPCITRTCGVDKGFFRKPILDSGLGILLDFRRGRGGPVSVFDNRLDIVDDQLSRFIGTIKEFQSGMIHQLFVPVWLNL